MEAFKLMFFLYIKPPPFSAPKGATINDVIKPPLDG